MFTAKQVLKRLINHVTEDNLVRSWFHLHENSLGESCFTEDACRSCIIGHINNYRSMMSINQRTKLDYLINRSRVNFYAPHTVEQVKSIYQRWLKKLEA